MNGREYEQPNITNEQYNELMGYLNMATSQLMDREKELAECKKDLLKLLPIARYNTNAFISYKEEENESGDEENDLKELGKDTTFIHELTAKYAEKPPEKEGE